MYGIAFDDGGIGLVTENGDVRYDEINLITKGGNYGFPTSQPANLPPERANGSSIKPLRSYWDTIAPTQMIYYDGDSVPELKGMFLFGSFTGDIYALKLSEDKKSIVEELKIELSHFPFVPTVGIAQSPDGKIYYGGYQIYTLDSIGERKQILFPIEVDLLSGVNIGEISVNQEQRRILIDAYVNGTIAPNATLTMRIPRSLLENVTTVTIDGQQGPSATEYDINEFGTDYSRVRVNIGSHAPNVGSLKITIY
jgi:hypothetical protein